MAEGSSISPYHNYTSSSARHLQSNFYTSNSLRLLDRQGGDNEKLDMIISQLSEQRETMIVNQEKGDAVLDLVQELSPTVSILQTGLETVRNEVSALKTGNQASFTKKQKQVPRYVSVSFVYNNALKYVQMKTCSSNILIKPAVYNCYFTVLVIIIFSRVYRKMKKLLGVPNNRYLLLLSPMLFIVIITTVIVIIIYNEKKVIHLSMTKIFSMSFMSFMSSYELFCYMSVMSVCQQ